MELHEISRLVCAPRNPHLETRNISSRNTKPENKTQTTPNPKLLQTPNPKPQIPTLTTKASWVPRRCRGTPPKLFVKNYFSSESGNEIFNTKVLMSTQSDRVVKYFWLPGFERGSFSRSPGDQRSRAEIVSVALNVSAAVLV